MRILLLSLSLLFSISLFSQNNIVFTAGLAYSNGPPTFNPGAKGTKYAIDTVGWDLYVNSYGTTWSIVGDWLHKESGCATPVYTPTKFQSNFVINECSPPELYYYNGLSWEQIGGGGSGTTDLTFTGSVSPITLNSSTGTDVQFKDSLGINIRQVGQVMTFLNTAPLLDGNKGDITVSGSGATWDINSGVVGPTELASTAVTPASYTNTNLTVDADGRITAASNGAAGLGGTGLTNRLGYYTDPNTLGYDVSMVLDTVNNRMGVNTQAPVRTLDVTGEARIADLTTDPPTRLVGADADGDLNEAGSGLANRLAYWTGVGRVGYESSFKVDSVNSRLGIGQLTPLTALHVQDNNSVGGITLEGSTFPAYQIKTGGVVRGYWTSATGAGGFLTNALANDMVFRTETAGSRVLFGSGASAASLVVAQSAVGFNIGAFMPGASVDALTLANTSSSLGLRVRNASLVPLLLVRGDTTMGVGTSVPFSRISYGELNVGQFNRKSNLALYETFDGRYFYGIGHVNPAGGGATDGLGIWGGTENAKPINVSSGTVNPSIFLLRNTRFVGFGDFSPTAIIDANGSGATSATSTLDVADSNDSTILLVRNDRRVGINTATPDVSFDMGESTDGFKMQAGTTAQRPSVNNTQRVNTDSLKVEVRLNGTYELYATGFRSNKALDFPSTAISSYSDLTLTVTGASVGDVCSLGVPASGQIANVSYNCWVSASNVVTVRLINNDVLAAADPTSGTFKVFVTK